MYRTDSNIREDISKTKIDATSFKSSKSDKPLITHIINGLYTGGAEMMLYKLLSVMNRERFDVQVISLIDGGEIRDKIESLGIEVYSLSLERKSPSLVGIRRLIQRLRQRPPDLIQTWMYHADLTGGVVGKLFTKAPIVWNIQASDFAYHPDNRRTLWTIKLCSFLSSFIPHRIISCSQVGCHVHADLGYDSSKLLPIPNGVELLNFRQDEAARISLRAELNLEAFTPLIGMIARFHPQKDHQNFIRAAARVNRNMPEVHFVLCGDEVVETNPHLAQWIAEAKLEKQVHLLGRRNDTPRINAALDVATLTSAYAEGFPNVLGEAMACEVPCVVTDIGDSALIVGDTGITVAPRDPDALAGGWMKILNLSKDERKNLGLKARQRVEAKFSLPSVVAQYEKLYSELLDLQ